MKLNDLRTLIREEIQNELAEAKKKKKKEATEKIMEIIAEAELTEVELEEAFEKLKHVAKQVVAKIGLGKSPAPPGNHEITPEALKAAFRKAPTVLKGYMEKYKMNLDQLIKLYQTEKGKEFNNARYWVQTWYDATVNKDKKAIEAWKNSDTNDAYKYLPSPEGVVGLASKAGNLPIGPGGI